MQWRSARAWKAMAPLFVATTLASCSQDSLSTGPLIVAPRVTSGNNQTAPIGSLLPSPLVVQVVDQRGQPVAGQVVLWAAVADDSLGSGVVTAPADTTDAEGFASSGYRLGPKVGLQAVTATIPGGQPVTFAVNGSPAPASKLTIVGGDAQSGPAGTRLATDLVVKVTDPFGNPRPGVTVNFTVVSGGGSVTPDRAASDTAGLAKARWVLGTVAGTQSLVVGSGSFAPVTFTANASPVNLVFESVAAAGRSSCAIDQGGVIYCWGFNGDGQVGIGAEPEGAGPIFTFPQAVAAATNQTFATISGGQYNHCATTFSHVGYCWGNNNNGQTGAGTTSRSENKPTLVGVTIPFITVSAGRTHACGLSIGGRGYCWGSNERGQLGGNVTIDTVKNTVLFVSSSAPVLIGRTTDGNFFTSLDLTAIAAGGVHSCGIDSIHNVFCWGLGREGQLGNGSNSLDEFNPQPVATGGVAMDSITAGYKHSCALSTTGDAYCWGEGLDGQLGTGSSGASNLPGRVSGGPFTQIAAGYAHTCAITVTGQAFCWGRNDRGQLGDASTTSRSVPVPVAGGLSFKTISAGDLSTCGVTTTKVAYCWGDNEYGALGDGTQVNRSVPTKVRLQQ